MNEMQIRNIFISSTKRIIFILSYGQQKQLLFSIFFIIKMNIKQTKINFKLQFAKQNISEMIKYYTSSAYRKHYSDLQKLNMLNETLQIQPYKLSLYVLRNSKQNTVKASKSPSKNLAKSVPINDPQKCFIQLIEDLEVYKNLTLTPIKAFKSLMLIHCCFLLVKTTPSEDNVNKLNQFFKWILQETVKMIEKYSTKQTKKRTSSFARQGNFFSRSPSRLLEGAKSLRAKSPGIPSSHQINQRPKSTGKYSNEQMLSKEICLLSSIVKPYILYLQKILSIYSHYQSLMHSIPSTISTSSESESAWTVLNILKLMIPIIGIFVYIGRYFYKDYAPIVHLLIEFFTKEVHRLYPILRAEVKKRTQEIQHQWFVMLEKHSEYQILHSPDIHIQGVDDTMLLVDEIFKANESLFYIYYGKHFYQVVQRLQIPLPKWLQINSKECEFIIHYVESKNKNKRRSSSRASKDKPKQGISTLKFPSSGNPPNSPKSKHVIIDQKNLIPKTKNSLKLGSNLKQSKDDAITFRLKQMHNNSMNRSNIMSDLSFRQEGSTDGSENTDNMEKKLDNLKFFEAL